MSFRKLRIAWSVFWGSACVLLIVLWVRSYWSFDRISWGVSSHSIIIISHTGHLSVVTTPVLLVWHAPIWDSGPIHPINYPYPDTFWPGPGKSFLNWIDGATYMNIPNGELGWDPRGLTGRSYTASASGVMTDYWLPIVAFATLAALPWIRGRFSLRTLLIATTLVAVALGLIVRSMR